MPLMGRKKKPMPPAAPEQVAKPKRFPSRERVKYVALPTNFIQALNDYADEHSDEDDAKSASWAARALIRKALLAEGKAVPPMPPLPASKRRPPKPSE